MLLITWGPIHVEPDWHFVFKIWHGCIRSKICKTDKIKFKSLYFWVFITALSSLPLFTLKISLQQMLIYFGNKHLKLRFRKQILEIMFSILLHEMSFTNGNFSFSVSPFLKISLHAPCFWQWEKVSDFQIFFGFLNNLLKFCLWMSHYPQADALSDCCTV